MFHFFQAEEDVQEQNVPFWEGRAETGLQNKTVKKIKATVLWDS